MDILKRIVKAGVQKNVYVVFDLETTGLSRYYSEIIQIAAIKIVCGKKVAEFNKYIKPRKPIPSEVTQINGITNEMVAGCSPFKSVVNEFLLFAADCTLVGYNIANFDLGILNNRMYMEVGRTLSAKYIDIYQMAQGISGLKDYKLTTLATHFGIPTEGAHNALVDCKMTEKSFEKLRELGIKARVEEYVGKPVSFTTKLSEASCSINILRAILSDIVSDGKVDVQEFEELKTWIRENEKLRGEYPFDNISNKVDEILADGVIQPEELSELVAFIDEWLDPVGHARHKTITSLKDRHVVITGDFEYGCKDDVDKYLVSKGAIIDNNVLKKTELVIVGALGSSAWVAGNYGAKIKKALEYREKGQVIEIISERDFFRETKKL